MKNANFILKSQEKKQTMIANTILHKTNHSLNPEQMRLLLLTLKSDRQYSVFIHREPQAMREAAVLVLSENRQDVGTVVFGQALPGRATDDGYTEAMIYDVKQAAAIIIRRVNTADGKGRMFNELHLYIPENLYMRSQRRHA